MNLPFFVYKVVELESLSLFSGSRFYDTVTLYECSQNQVESAFFRGIQVQKICVEVL